MEGFWVERKGLRKGLEVGGTLSSDRSVHYRNARANRRATGGERNPNGSAVEDRRGTRGPPPCLPFRQRIGSENKAPDDEAVSPAFLRGGLADDEAVPLAPPSGDLADLGGAAVPTGMLIGAERRQQDLLAKNQRTPTPGLPVQVGGAEPSALTRGVTRAACRSSEWWTGFGATERLVPPNTSKPSGPHAVRSGPLGGGHLARLHQRFFGAEPPHSFWR